MPPGSLAAPYGQLQPCEVTAKGRGPVVILTDPVAGWFARPTRLGEVLAARWRALALDHALACGAAPERDAVTFLRARRLVSRKVRDETAHSLQRLVACSGWHPPWSRPHSYVLSSRVALAGPALTALSDALSGPQPVQPRGVALARQLLTDGAGPLYRAATPDTIVTMAEEALRALDA
jgi:hypothetical protein